MFFFFILANSSADLNPNHTNTAITIIGKTKIILYTNKYIYHHRLRFLLSEARYQSIVKYGQEVQGNRNKLTITQTTKAHPGDAIFSIKLAIFGLHPKGTSITNHFPYRKKSFKLASHTNIPNIQTISLIK